MEENKQDRIIELLEQIDKNIELIAKVYRVSIASTFAKVQAQEKLKKSSDVSGIQKNMKENLMASDEIKIELKKVT